MARGKKRLILFIGAICFTALVGVWLMFAEGQSSLAQSIPCLRGKKPLTSNVYPAQIGVLNGGTIEWKSIRVRKETYEFEEELEAVMKRLRQDLKPRGVYAFPYPGNRKPTGVTYTFPNAPGSHDFMTINVVKNGNGKVLVTVQEHATPNLIQRLEDWIAKISGKKNPPPPEPFVVP